MKRKINRYLVVMSVAAAVITTLCLTFVFYGLFRRQVQSGLRVNAEVLRDTGIFEPENTDSERSAEIFDRLRDDFRDSGSLRVTWIDPDGRVLYDNDRDASTLENHSDRPEVEQALEQGEGESIRHSDTMNKTTFYYALRLGDGSVLRLSSDANSLFSVFASGIPAIVGIVALIILAAAVTARVLTRQLLAPISRISKDMANPADTPVYEELVPFVSTIREQHDNILSAAKARQDFTANVSHELKTPLTAISGYAELIENHMVDAEKETEFAEQIRINSDRLLALIEDTIRLSELDQSENAVTFEPMDLYRTAESCMELLRVSAEQKNIHLSLEGESCPMQGNRDMVEELINNLCQNAVHYNKENGQVTVTVRTEQGRPTLTVADTGIGIPADLQERVFERFFRVDKSRSRETGGTGLGLSIVKHIVEIHDAEISLESEVGVGTTIMVRF